MTGKLKKFNFPDEKSNGNTFNPRQINKKIDIYQSIIGALSGLLVSSFLLIFLLLIIFYLKADAIAYVADGGVFGCQVK